MSERGIHVSNEFLLALHKELLNVFSDYYSVELKTFTVFQLYGFENYEEELPSLKKFIIEKQVSGLMVNTCTIRKEKLKKETINLSTYAEIICLC